MHFRIFNVLAGVVGLAVIVASAPALSSNNSDVCAPISTIFVTVHEPVTVTVHDATTDTVHLSYGAAPLPTTTITRTETSQSTITVAPVESIDSTKAAASTSIPYDTTIYETVTVTRLQTGHSSSTSTSTSTILAFIVEDGTTFWVGEQTPVPTKSYLTTISVVTVQPIDTPMETISRKTTLTVHSTLFTTQRQTLTRTLHAFNGSAYLASGAHTASSFGAAPSSAPTTSSWAGWNTTSTARGFFPGATDPAKTSKSSKSEISLITDETVNIYETTHYSYPTSAAHTAKSGFNVFTTTNSSLTHPSATSTAEGVWTTTFIDGETVSWYAPGFTQSCVNSSSHAPYANTTSTSHGITSADPSSTSSAQGFWTTAVINGQTVSWNDPYSIATTTTFNVPHIDPTSSSSIDMSSSAPTTFVTSNSSSSLSSAVRTIFVSTATVIPIPVSSSTLPSSFHFDSPNSTISASPNMLDSPTSVPLPSSFALSTGTIVLDTTSLLSISSTAIPSSHMDITSGSSSFLTLVAPSTNADAVSTTSSAAIAASSGPSKCGDSVTTLNGDFILNFDDIPPMSINNDTTFAQASPIFSPYHLIDFSKGFNVGPRPGGPFLPESEPLLAEFTPYIDPSTGDEDGNSGFMGNVDHGLTSCFSFNFYGASFGCDSFGPDCHFNFTGYRYNATDETTKPVASEQKVISACSTLMSLDCVLTSITLSSDFQKLDSIRIDVTVNDVPKIWWMDNVRLGWSDNTCEKGMCRAKAPLHGFVLPKKKV